MASLFVIKFWSRFIQYLLKTLRNYLRQTFKVLKLEFRHPFYQQRKRSAMFHNRLHNSIILKYTENKSRKKLIIVWPSMNPRFLCVQTFGISLYWKMNRIYANIIYNITFHFVIWTEKHKIKQSNDAVC